MSEIFRIKSVTEAHKLFNLPKPKHPLVSVWHHNNENFDQDFGDARFSSDLYLIAFKDGAYGSIGYGRNSYDFEEGMLMFMKPGQVTTPGKTQSEFDNIGWTLIFHPDLIRKSELGKTIETYSFFSYDVNEALHLSEDEKQNIGELVLKIENEYLQNIDKHSQALIVSGIQMLLDYSRRYYDRQFYTRTNLNKDFISKFDELIRNYYESKKALELGVPSVKFFASELNMSPKYLSDLLKKETGKSTMELIHSYIINKAKTELLNSTEPISQIAYGLGFEYPQHFSKIFKAKTGMSPAEYRNVN